jgi:hypothetical protein
VRRAAAGALSLLALAPVGLSACGSGGATTTTTDTVSAAPPATTAPTASATTTTSSPAGTAATRAAEASNASPSSGSSSSGGGAASFRTAHGDNSIPDYGQEAAPSERARATAALAAYLRARAGGEWSTACSYLVATTRKQLEQLARSAKRGGGDCGKILAGFSAGPAAARADPLVAGIAALRVKGSSAFVLFHGPHDSKYVMPMRDEGGAWKVSQPVPLPYPLGSSGAAP